MKKLAQKLKYTRKFETIDRLGILPYTLYVRLHNGKIWVETDWIEEAVTEKLLAAGVPKEDIVLAFQHPSLSDLGEFAVA